MVMNENNKYELEDMIEAYHRYMERIDQRIGEGHPPVIDFDRLKARCRAERRMSRRRVCSVAAVMALILFVVTPATDGYGMTSVVNRPDTVVCVNNCLIGYEKEG